MGIGIAAVTAAITIAVNTVIGVSMRDLFEDKNFKASDSF
jgi:hypothetical protein